MLSLVLILLNLSLCRVNKDEAVLYVREVFSGVTFLAVIFTG